MRNTFVRPFMIVIDEDPCSDQFASILKNSKHTKTGDFGTPFFHSVNDSGNLLADLSNMLYKATVNSVTTIILLCSDYLTELIFRLAKVSAISHSNNIWVAIEFSSSVADTVAPSLLLSILQDLSTESSIPVLNNSANILLNAKAIASLAVKEQTVTKL